MDESGNVRMRDSKSSFVIWNVNYNDVGNEETTAKNNMSDIYDDDIIDFSKDSLEYTIKGVVINAPFTLAGESNYYREKVQNTKQVSNPATEIPSGNTTREGNAIVDTDTGAVVEGNTSTSNDTYKYRKVEVSKSVSNSDIAPDSFSEMQSIKDQAITNGTFMKAPNGKPTNLNERQWLQVRTKAFKEWFGDWEKVARSSKFRESLDIPNSITSATYQGITVGEALFDPDMAPDGGKRIISLGDKYIGEIPVIETKAKIRMGGSIGAATEIEEEYRGKGYGKKAHLALANIAKSEGKILYSDSSNSDAEDALWKSLVRDGIAEVISERPKVGHWNHITYRILNDKLPQADDINSGDRNVSKVVDENGEPLVVYHRSDAENISIFKPNEYGPKHSMSIRFGKGASFFTDNKNDTRWGKYQTSYFLNIRVPFETSFQIESNDNAVARYKQQKEDKPETDGIFNIAYDEDYKYDELVVFNPNQIKSATDNIGTFDANNPDIRYRKVPSIAQLRAQEKSAYDRFNNDIEEYYREARDIIKEVNYRRFNTEREAMRAFNESGIRKDFFYRITREGANNAAGYKIQLLTRDMVEQYKQDNNPYSDEYKDYTTPIENFYFDSLGPEIQMMLFDKGWTKEQFDSISQQERDQAVKCIAL